MVQDVSFHRVPLGFQEHLGPQDLDNSIICSDELGVSAAGSVDLLLARHRLDSIFSKGYDCSSVAFKVGMHCKRSIHMPLDHIERICAQGKDLSAHTIQVLDEMDELSPISLIGLCHPCTQPCNGGLNVWMCSLADKETFCNSSMELLCTSLGEWLSITNIEQVLSSWSHGSVCRLEFH